GDNADADPSTLKNLPSRPQSSNAAFGLQPTYEFDECQLNEARDEVCNSFAPQAPVKSFTDDKGWVPGLAVREDGFNRRDCDASALVPSTGHAPHTTPIVNPDGSPATDYYRPNLGFTVAGSGNPADSGVGCGTFVTVAKAMFGNQAAQI